MNGRFSNQSVVITGAGQGIGFEIARRISLEGGAVLLNDLDAMLADRAAAVIRALGGICQPFAGDASDLDFIQRLVDEAVARFGFLSIGIANAGITSFGAFLDYRPEQLQQVINLNLTGSFFLAQKTARQIARQKSGGSILLMSSVTGHQAHQHLEAYGMTKAALEMLAKGLVLELSPLQITVNALAPGATLTERTLEERGYQQTWSRITPMGRPASVEDVAAAALFLVAPESRHITGQTLVVDGGWTSTSPSPYN